MFGKKKKPVTEIGRDDYVTKLIGEMKNAVSENAHKKDKSICKNEYWKGYAGVLKQLAYANFKPEDGILFDVSHEQIREVTKEMRRTTRERVKPIMGSKDMGKREVKILPDGATYWGVNDGDIVGIYPTRIPGMARKTVRIDKKALDKPFPESLTISLYHPHTLMLFGSTSAKGEKIEAGKVFKDNYEIRKVEG